MGVSRRGGHDPFVLRHRRRERPDRARSEATPERGASLVEFALVMPILFTLVFGVIDFGLVLTDSIGIRQGVREGARQATVADWGTTDSCGLQLTGAGTAEMKKLMCLTKSRSDMPSSSLKVAIRFDPVNSGLSASNAYPAGTGAAPSGPVGNGIIVCAITPMSSRTGFFTPIMGGKYVRSKVVMRIERAAGSSQSPTQEADPSGENWAWCTA